MNINDMMDKEFASAELDDFGFLEVQSGVVIPCGTAVTGAMDSGLHDDPWQTYVSAVQDMLDASEEGPNSWVEKSYECRK